MDFKISRSCQRKLNHRGRRFGRTTEQQALLNNRKPADDAEAKKEAFDGTADSVKDKGNHKDDQPSAGAASAQDSVWIIGRIRSRV